MLQSSFKSISVIGLGYVGLPTAATIASRGVPVIGVDVNKQAVEIINKGESHIIETDLDVVLKGAVAIGRFRATTAPEPADAFLITVPTPIAADKKADLAMVEAAFRSVAKVLEKGNLIVLESTSPVGTTERMTRLLEQLRPDLKFPTTHPERADVLVAYCPERILPGHTLRELVENSRTIGGLDKQSSKRAVELYRIFCMSELVETSSRAAELTKLVENAYRDVNIAFANELSMICSDLDIDVHDVIEAANRHPRVNILKPGPGVGGHCIAVDPWFIVEAAPERAKLIHAARTINDFKAEFVFDQIRARTNRFKQPVVAFLGLAYKPDVDDLRESPAVEIVKHAVEQGIGDILIVEPHIDKLPRELHGKAGVRLVGLSEAMEKADVVAILVAHQQFQAIKSTHLSEKAVIDPVGLLRKI